MRRLRQSHRRDLVRRARVAPLAVALLLLASFVSLREIRDEPPSRRSSSAVDRRTTRALAALANAIDGRPGTALSSKHRKRMLKVVAFAAKEVKKDVCTALRAVDFLREPLADTSSFRGKGLPRSAETLDRRVAAAGNAMIEGAEMAGCAVEGTSSDVLTLGPPGAPAPPGKPPLRDDQDDEMVVADNVSGPTWTDPGTQVQIVEAPKTPRTLRADNPSNPITISGRTDVGIASGASPHDMQVASADNVVLVSGNGGAFYSVNSGQTFQTMNQAAIFGNGEGGFCCDPVLRYAPQIDRFILLLQGNCSSGQTCPTNPDNRMVLAVASPSAITDLSQSGQAAEAAWSTAQITQQLLRETSTWWDYPAMSVGDTQLYLVWNRQRTGSLADGIRFVRISLAELASGRFRLFHFAIDGPFFPRLAQRSGSLGLMVNNQDTSDAEAFYLRETSGIMFRANLPHTRIPTNNWGSSSPGGANWTGAIGGEAVKGATVRGNELWVAWSAARGYPGGANIFPHPHIQYAVYRIETGGLFEELRSSFRLITWPLLQEGNLWNDTYAIMDPALDTNAEGDVGIVLSYGGPTQEPSAAAGILTGRGIELLQILGSDSTPGFDNVQGHYNGIHRDSPNGIRFVATGVIVKNDPGPVTNPHYVFMRFGRD